MPTRDPKAVSAARRLRADATPAERALWSELRRDSTAHWRRQAPVGGFIADFACLRAKLVVEVDGGAHDHAAAERRDAARTAKLEAQGYAVRRVTNVEVLHNPRSVADDLNALAISRLHSAGIVGDDEPVSRSGAPVATSHPVDRPVPHPQPLPQHALEEGGNDIQGTSRLSSRRSRYDFSETHAPTQVDPESLVLVGAIAGAFGVKGEVRVRAFTAAPDGVVSYGPLYDAQGRVVLTPKRWRDIKDGLAVSGPEIKDRNAAEAARGTPLHVPRDVMPPAAEDEFYHVDLIGCRIEALDGAVIGMVHAVHNFGAGDIIEVKPHTGANWYLDFTKATVPVVDLANGRLVATPLEAEPETP